MENESETDMKMWYAGMGDTKTVLICGAVTVFLLVSGCGSKPPVPEQDARPDVLYSNVWSADSDIRLLDRGPELVRATYEASIYATFVGADDSYPGYRGAVGGPTSRGNVDKREYFTWRKPEGTQQLPRTDFNHITSYSETDTRISAVVCSYYLFPDNRDNPSFEPLGAATTIELDRTTEVPLGAPGIPDQSPSDAGGPDARMPTWDVFGGWKIRRIVDIDTLSGGVNPDGCVNWWQQQFPMFTSKSPQNVLSKPDGFVPPTQPIAVQYPEWIGPAKPE